MKVCVIASFVALWQISFFHTQMGSTKTAANGTKQEPKHVVQVKPRDSLFETLLITLIGLGFVLLVFVAARNSLAWYNFRGLQ